MISTVCVVHREVTSGIIELVKLAYGGSSHVTLYVVVV